MNKILFAAASVFALGLAGCAADTQSTDGASSTTEALRQRQVGEGGHCGGNVANPNTCLPGLECKLGSNPDKGGTCEYAQLGEHCGGNMATAVKCAAGLVCQGGPLVGDVGGTCQLAPAPVVGYGEHCGGNMVNAPRCEAGLKCRLTGVPDVGGWCDYAQYGETCGGNMTSAVQCDVGLTCVSSNPDVAGICE